MRFLLLGLAAAAVAATAHANEVDNIKAVDIAVSGSIRQHCAIGSVNDMDFGDLERRGLGIRSRVAFDCNVPFTMTIKSVQGALTNIAMPNGQGPYGGSLPYSLGWKCRCDIRPRRCSTAPSTAVSSEPGASFPVMEALPPTEWSWRSSLACLRARPGCSRENTRRRSRSRSLRSEEFRSHLL